MNATYANMPMVNSHAAEPAYGISAWPDTDEIYARLAALVKQPIRPIRRENMEKVLNYFEQRCVQSRQLSERAEKVIPGGKIQLALTAATSAFSEAFASPKSIRVLSL